MLLLVDKIDGFVVKVGVERVELELFVNDDAASNVRFFEIWPLFVFYEKICISQNSRTAYDVQELQIGLF